jgi:hypothetical protein
MKMPKYRVYATVRGTKFIGEFEAASKEEAIEKGLESDECYTSVCYQCAEQVEDPEIDELFAEEVTDA